MDTNERITLLKKVIKDSMYDSKMILTPYVLGLCYASVVLGFSVKEISDFLATIQRDYWAARNHTTNQKEKKNVEIQ